MSIANYKEHRQAFSALLEKECNKPILLFKGESGTGKSTLIKHCRSQIDKDINHVLIDLRYTSNFLQISEKLSECLDLEHSDNFNQQLDKLNQQLNINVTGNTQAGAGNMISLALNETLEHQQRTERYTALTKAWIREINNLGKQCVLFIDVYEKASSEIEQWVNADLLNCVAKFKKMRVVIAGKSLPENPEWEHLCEFKELYGVHEAEEWMPVIKAMGRRVPIEPQLTYLAGICYALKGNPAEIAKIIKDFPSIQ
jgi:hypothetical protein